MASISERESREIEAANASGTTPVVLHPRPLAAAEQLGQLGRLFKQAGYAPLTPDWPDDPETVEEARANPDVLAKKTLKQVADHTADVIGKLEKKPAVMGHSTGGLFAQMLAGRGSRQPRLPSTRGVFAASCRCPPLHAQDRLDLPDQPPVPRPRHHAHPRPVQIWLGERAR